MGVRGGMESTGCTNSALGPVSTESLEGLESLENMESRESPENIERAEAMGSAEAMESTEDIDRTAIPKKLAQSGAQPPSG